MRREAIERQRCLQLFGAASEVDMEDSRKKFWKAGVECSTEIERIKAKLEALH